MDAGDEPVARRDLDEVLGGVLDLVRAQAARIDELERQLAASAVGAQPTVAAGSDDAPSATGQPARPDRRSLLRSAGLATAGALGGAGVLAQAAPAVAAPGTFDGNPAVLGTANPTSGLGVRGDSVTGTGVLGRTTSASGSGIGVQGNAASPNAIAVAGANSAGSGDSVGVRGTSLSTVGIGVLGQTTAVGVPPSGENPIGVSGISFNPGGIGVQGFVDSTAGTTAGVKGAVTSQTGVGVLAVNQAGGGNAVALRATNSSNNGRTAEIIATGRLSTTTALVADASASPSGRAVLATGGATGLRAESSANGTPLEIQQGKVAMRLLGLLAPPPTTSTTYSTGDVAFDAFHDLWICVFGGTPGTWRRLGGESTAGALALLETPVRVNDSRPGEVPLNSTKGPITGNTTRVIDMKNNSSGVPAGATAVLCTLTVVNTSANGGFLALFRNGAATPATSTINWTAANQVVGTTTVTAVDATAQAKIFCPPNSSTNYFVDVIGFYR